MFFIIKFKGICQISQNVSKFQKFLRAITESAITRNLSNSQAIGHIFKNCQIFKEFVKCSRSLSILKGN
jgi:hypothetical protein